MYLAEVLIEVEDVCPTCGKNPCICDDMPRNVASTFHEHHIAWDKFYRLVKANAADIMYVTQERTDDKEPLPKNLIAAGTLGQYQALKLPEPDNQGVSHILYVKKDRPDLIKTIEKYLMRIHKCEKKIQSLPPDQYDADY